MPVMTDKPQSPEESVERAPENDADEVSVLPASRDNDGADVPPPVSIPGKGPMDQAVPDVPTGSTPLTRHDD